jgi:hypothetical protein
MDWDLDIAIFNPGNWNPDELHLDHILSAAYLLAEELILDEETQKNGIVNIVDHGNLSFYKMRKIAGQISLGMIRKLISLFQVRRLKAILHFTSLPNDAKSKWSYLF